MAMTLILYRTCPGADNLPVLLSVLERVMSSRVSTYGVRSAVVIPAHAGIQAVPRIWIPASAGMTLHLDIHAPGRAFNRHNTL